MIKAQVQIPDGLFERALSRQHQQLLLEWQQLQRLVRNLLAMHGIHLGGKWWKGKTWAMIRSEAPAWVMERIKAFIVLIQPVAPENAS